MDKKAAGILIVVMALGAGVLYTVVTRNSDRPEMKTDTTPAEEAAMPEETAPQTKNDEELIKEALIAKNNWDNGDDLLLTIAENDGEYARGGIGPVTPGPGGGLWFAAKRDGMWKIVWDGNGVTVCENLADYPDFPKDMIPQCYDSQTGKMVAR